jgi:hypothetical protein
MWVLLRTLPVKTQVHQLLSSSTRMQHHCRFPEQLLETKVRQLPCKEGLLLQHLLL